MLFNILCNSVCSCMSYDLLMDEKSLQLQAICDY
jgi:hypothetical protein